MSSLVFKMGFLGTTAPILIDINLILQYMTLVLLVIGYVKRRQLKTHSYLMLLVLLLTVVTTLVVMAPRLLLTATNFGVTVYGHATVGTIAILLGALYAARFINATRNEQPLACGTKRNMRIALILWIVPVLFGTMMYVALYV